MFPGRTPALSIQSSDDAKHKGESAQLLQEIRTGDAIQPLNADKQRLRQQ